MGTTSIWLTPSFKNKAVQLEDGPSAGYHGYWVTDFTQIDPHLGTNAELRALVDAAHERGMKVYFDIITNHTADVIGYAGRGPDGLRPQGRRAVPDRLRHARSTTATTPARTTSRRCDPDVSFPYTPVLDPGEQNLKVPSWLNDVTLYHNRGNTTFTGEDSYYGDFFGLDDLFTEHPRVVGGMIDIYKTWIREMGIDGFRIDTMKHVDDEFWQRFGPEVLAYARSQGKDEFFMFGEVFDTSRPFTSQYTTRNRMQAVLDFPFQDAARNFASKSQPSGQLQTLFLNDDWYTDANSNVYQLPTFLGNHDMGRIGHFVSADNAGAVGGRAGGPGPAGARADVLLPRQPGGLLRRRAGLHRHRRRPGGPAVDVRQPGPGVPRRRSARHDPDPRRGQLRHRATRCTAASASWPR